MPGPAPALPSIRTGLLWLAAFLLLGFLAALRLGGLPEGLALLGSGAAVGLHFLSLTWGIGRFFPSTGAPALSMARWGAVMMIRWALLGVILYAIIRVSPGREAWILVGAGLAFLAHLVGPVRTLVRKKRESVSQDPEPET